ncbi:unnamed protein product [Musa textilis]
MGDLNLVSFESIAMATCLGPVEDLREKRYQATRTKTTSPPKTHLSSPAAFLACACVAFRYWTSCSGTLKSML